MEKKLKLKTTKAKTREFFSKNVICIPAIPHHVYAYFLVKKYVFQTIVLKIKKNFK